METYIYTDADWQWRTRMMKNIFIITISAIIGKDKTGNQTKSSSGKCVLYCWHNKWESEREIERMRMTDAKAKARLN